MEQSKVDRDTTSKHAESADRHERREGDEIFAERSMPHRPPNKNARRLMSQVKKPLINK